MHRISEKLLLAIRMEAARNVTTDLRSKRLRKACKSRFVAAMKSSSLPSDCAQFAPQLTALFDGEADEAQALQARAHLLSCPACSRLWLDWTRYRSTLQSEPVPAPPPTLLWRVLIAYRVAAFAQPARRGHRLPLPSATMLRELEAPLPPRLSEHILARTTRKPCAHVMLTPLDGASERIRPRQSARLTRFRRVSLWAAPALALWVLMLNRADFLAVAPLSPPASMVSGAPGNSARNGAPASAQPGANPLDFAPVPVLPPADDAQASPTKAGARPDLFASRVLIARGNLARPLLVAQPATVARAKRAGATDDLGRALLLAINADRRDVAQARNARTGAAMPTPAAPSIEVAAPAPVGNAQNAPAQNVPAQNVPTPVANAQNANAQAANAQNANAQSGSGRRAGGAPVQAQAAPVSNARVRLAALTAPFTSIRAVTSARLRAASFSEDSSPARAASLSAAGRRLARALPDDSAASLRVSRPNAEGPTLREVRFTGDSGPRIEDVRSAVDDFRASVAGGRFGDE